MFFEAKDLYGGIVGVCGDLNESLAMQQSRVGSIVIKLDQIAVIDLLQGVAFAFGLQKTLPIQLDKADFGVCVPGFVFQCANVLLNRRPK